MKVMRKHLRHYHRHYVLALLLGMLLLAIHESVSQDPASACAGDPEMSLCAYPGQLDFQVLQFFR